MSSIDICVLAPLDVDRNVVAMSLKVISAADLVVDTMEDSVENAVVDKVADKVVEQG